MKDITKEELPHMEDADTNYIPPRGEYEKVRDKEHYTQKWAEWEFSGKTPKDTLWYKGYGYKRMVTIVGYEVRGENDTLVIEFQDGNLSCILPAFLKEMQKPTFQRKTTEEDGEETKEKKTAAPKKDKKPKLVLPAEKVSCTATIKEFTKKLNHFSGKEEDMVIYENLLIEEKELVPGGLAWSSYSKTLQKHNVQVGTSLSFQAKVAANTFGDALCKVNSPSQIKITE